MSAMSRQFVLELEFKVKNRNPLRPEKQLVIVDEGSISELSKLREDLGNFTTEPFIIQYLDEENDLVSIDTEEEFKEFTKLVMHRSSKGEVQKIVLNCNPILVSERTTPKVPLPSTSTGPAPNYSPKDIEKAKEQWTAFALRECFKRICKGGVIKEWQIKYKDELKQEILSEMKEELGAAFQPNVSRKELDEYEEDSDGNSACRHEKKKLKLHHNFKKLEKKEKQLEKKKIDQRIEKLELKKKKLMEKAYLLRAAYKYSIANSPSGFPVIMSGIASTDSSFLSKEVAAGKAFVHQWRVFNDGTVAWKDVQLQHSWSTPGLQPEQLIVKCTPLFPGQECLVMMRFRAPKTIGPFVSYWHLVHGLQLTQFGHYVSLTGNTKLSNLTSGSGEQTGEQDDHEMTEKKTVTFNDEAEVHLVTYLRSLNGNKYGEEEITLKKPLEITLANAAKLARGTAKKHRDASLASAEIAAEMEREAANKALEITLANAAKLARGTAKKHLDASLASAEIAAEMERGTANKPLEITLANAAKLARGTAKKHLDASLASAEIAAEMAREAARVSSGMQTDKHEILSEMDEVIKNCQELHLESSESDTDVNISVNEETDPEFVFVNIPSGWQTEQNKPQVKNIQNGLDMDIEKEEKETNVFQNQKSDEIVTSPTVTEDMKKEQDDISTSTVIENKTIVPKEVIEVAQEVSEPPLFDSVNMSCNPNLNNKGPDVQKSFTKLQDDQQAPHMGYPRLDPHVNYPVMGPAHRVPMSMYPPQQHPTHGYPMFAPQNSSSHGIVFPPPPMNYLPTHKMNPPHYQQIPIPIPFPSVMASPAEIGLHHVPFHPSTPSNCIFPQNVPRDVLSCGGVKDNTLQHIVSNKASSVPIPKIPEPCSTLIETNKNVEDKNENPNQQMMTKETITESAFTTNVTTENQHVPMHGDSNSDAPVHILPQGLVNGAINVASTAYSHAWNALNNLRPKDCQTQEFDPVFENNMALLIEMGFRNVERNARLLKRFKNDVNQVIGVICAFPGGDNLEID